MRFRHTEKLAALFAVILLSTGNVTAGEHNPFLGKAGALSKKSTTKRKISLPAQPPSTLSFPPPPVLGGVPMPIGLPGSPSQTKPSWQVVGMINGQVTLANNSGQIAIVDNGSSKDSCLIDYPNIYCDAADISSAMQRRQKTPQMTAPKMSASNRIPMAMDPSDGKNFVLKTDVSAHNVQSETIRQKEVTLDTEQIGKKLKAAEKELAETKSSFEILKKQQEISATTLDQRERELSELKKSVNAVNSELSVKLKELISERKTIADLRNEKNKVLQSDKSMQKDLEILRQEVSAKDLVIARLTDENKSLKAETERIQVALRDLRNRDEQSPVWARSLSNEYQDTQLGVVSLGKGEKEVCFRVSGRVEGKADTLFGKSVFRKEKKGEFVYYAIDRRAVSIRGI